MLQGLTRMSPTIGELAKALSKAQKQFKPLQKSGKANYGPFSTINDIIEASEEALYENGLAVVQVPSGGGDGYVCITTTLLHASNEFISGELIIPVENNTAQKCGSAISYARRYARASILGLASEDDDGTAAQKTNARPNGGFSNFAQGQNTSFQAKPTGVALTPGEGASYMVNFGKYKGQRLSEISPNALRDYKNYLENKGDLKGPGRDFVNAADSYLNSIADEGLPPLQNDDLPPLGDEDIPF